MALTSFDDSVFNGKAELSFLHFKKDFHIDFDTNSIIFAFNGVCKTTISNYLAKNYEDQFFLINYEEDKESIKTIKNGKKIEILPDVVELHRAEDNLSEVKKNIKLFERIEKGFGLSKSKIDKSIDYLKSAKDSESISKISLTKEEFNEINDVLSPVKAEFGKNFRNLIDGVHKVTDEINNMQDGLVKKFCEDYLAHMQIGEDKIQCPICNGPIPSGLHLLLLDKISKLNDVAESYFSDYLVKNNEKRNSDFLLKLSDLIAKYQKDERKLCEYLIIDGYEEVAELNSLIDDQVTKKGIVDSKNNVIKSIATGIKKSEVFIKDFFIKRFGFSNARFDDNKSGLILTTPNDRSASSYSQGELNLMTLITRLTIAKSTDKTNIILDDPLSSYDIPNQYRILYEIVKYIREDNTGKKVLIFTHNVDALNIANQYNYGCDFKFFYIEKCNSELSIEQLSIKNNVIDIDDIIKSHDAEGFLEANRDRENPLFNDPVIKVEDLHKLFHYNGSISSCVYKTKNLSNQSLIDKIDNYKKGDIVDNNFILNTVNKIVYLMAVRVYVEKKLFDINSTVASKLSNLKTFGEKLREIGSSHLPAANAKYPNLQMDSLKSMKVMLNQNEHYKSQVQPYYYAMNISLDELNNEIEEVKRLFS